MADNTALAGSAVREVAELAQEAQTVQYRELEDGRILADRSLVTAFDPEEQTWPSVYDVHSLTGVAEYIESNPDGLDIGECILHVASPSVVRLDSTVLGPERDRKRFIYVRAEAIVPSDGLFNAWFDLEELIIRLQSQVQPRLDRDIAMKLLAGVKDADEKEVRDDGVSQKVSVKSGPSLIDLEEVPNPIVLAPYRTFPEVEDQPQSPFILRIKRGSRGVEAGLMEADGGAWRQAAISAVAEWFGKRLSGSVKIIG